VIKMGFFDSISDMLEAALPWSTAEADAPAAKEEETQVGAFFLI
jgi:ubiquinol-cytochrome c reductase subunit 6